jgi:iron transport multicopper oxidase
LLEEKLSAAGVKKTLLKLPFAFHSVQMDPILDDIRLLANNIEFRKPTVPVASTLLGSLIRDEGVFTPDYLARQARQPVRFQEALQTCKAEGIANDGSLWIEMGPQPLCHGMVRSTLGLSPAKALPSLKRDEDCWLTISRSMANAYNNGVKLNWVDYHRDFQSALRLLELPSYAFDLKDYWIQHVGDWSLRKGETVSAVTAPPPKAAFSTTCLQQVENELFTNDSASVTFSSQLSEPKLNTAVRGHLVNGIGLCPSSVYADVAFTAAWYIASRTTPSDPVPAMDLSTMEVFRPLIVDSNQTSQLLRVSASRKSNEKTVNIVISSEDEKGRQEHAHCTVEYGDGQQWMDEWQRNAYLIQSRIEGLTKPANPAGTHRLLKDMIYKQFQTVVTYSKEYHNIDELFMDCELNETAANIKFQSTAGNGQFVYSPYWIDTVAHLAGFVLNASVKTPADTVFISHGWESFRIAAPLSDEKAYRGYVRMQPSGSRGVQAGDVYIFDGDEIVVVCKGIKFQQMKRTTLQSLLGTGHQGSTAPKSVATKPTRQRQAIMRKPVTAPAAQNFGGGFSKILETIASEVGVEVSELGDDVKISDVGVDSLLTISILGRLRPDTGLDLPSSLFIEYPSIAQLKAFFLDKMALLPAVVDDDDSDSSSEDESPGFSRSHSNSTISTPEEPDAIAVLMSIIASEVGIEESEIQLSTPFAEIGVDSLLTISILDAYKTEIGINLSANFFHENPTFSDVQKALGVPAAPQKPLDLPLARPEKKSRPSEQDFRSKSVLLQGRPEKGRQALFLLPDGAGSLFSYISLPALPSGVPVYGLDSPFHNSPIDYNISFEAVAAIYIQEIRKIQPHGPYMLGGWSLGGIHAYETSRQLIAQGETITNLIMIDSPCPGTLPPLPSPTLNLLEKAGVFDGLSTSGGPVTERTRLHFLGSVRALEHYTATPLPAGKSPGKVTVIWAQEGVLEGREEQGKEYMAATSSGDINADMDKAKQWLTGKRDSFGPSGWDKLTGTEVACHVVGGNHFSIMFPPKVRSRSVSSNHEAC